jgi:hypothetical protein
MTRSAKSPAPQPVADRCLRLLKCLLKDEWLPEKSVPISYVALTSDLAEGVQRNYAYLSYRRGDTGFRVQCYASGPRVLVEPPTGSLDPAVVALVAQCRETPPDKLGGLKPDAAQQEALTGLWTRYLRVAPPSLSEPKGSVRTETSADRRGYCVSVAPVPLDGPDRAWSVEMDLDGRAVGFQAHSDEALEAELHRAWRSPPGPLPSRPLNPDYVLLENKGRQLNAEGQPTNTPGRGGSCLIGVALRNPVRPTSRYAWAGYQGKQTRVFWVHSDTSEISAEIWQTCEFDALTEDTLATADATICGEQLLSDLEDRQTRHAAAIGLMALKADYDRVCARYAGLVIPPSSTALAEEVRTVLTRGARAWDQTATTWGQLAATHPDPADPAYEGLAGRLSQQMGADHTSPSDLRAAIARLQDKAGEHAHALGVDRAIEVGG